MSAFTTVVGRLGELSESELRQLHLIVGVRLGLTEGGQSTQRAAGRAPNKGSGGKAKVAKPSGGAKKASSKGNPSRKSQWETHPLYREYKRLKKVVEAQAKEGNTSFAAVDTPEREAYNSALSQWLGAKSSFRDRSGPEEKSAEATSAKGKEKATTPAPPVTAAVSGGSSTANGGGSSWADAVQDAMDVESDSGSEAESEGDPIPGTSPKVPSVPKRTARQTRLPSRETPPKKTSGVSARK